jgi:cytochrome c oxidase assembly factor CtaG
MLGHAGGGHDVSLWTSWTFDPLALVAIAGAAFLYYRRTSTLARRDQPVAAWRQVLFGLGLVMLAFALFSPMDAVGEEELFFVHMIQHILIGELAPLALVAGLTGPILRPVLQFRVVRGLRALAHPLVAFPLWALNLYVWHLPTLYESALTSTPLHALEHICFLTAGALFWAPVLEPLPAPRWFGSGAKLLYIVAARFTSMVLANVLIWNEGPVYASYDHAVDPYGISAAADQGMAGSVMMIVDSIVTIAAIAWPLPQAGERGRAPAGRSSRASTRRRPPAPSLRPQLNAGATLVRARSGASRAGFPRGSASGTRPSGMRDTGRSPVATSPR